MGGAKLQSGAISYYGGCSFPSLIFPVHRRPLLCPESYVLEPNMAAQKLPYLETLSCLQVVATFGNIEICQNWQSQSIQEWKTTQQIKNFQNRKLPFCQNWQKEQMWKLLMHHFWVTTKFPKVELPKKTPHNTPCA